MRQRSTTSNASGPICGRAQREADRPAGATPIAEVDLTPEEAGQVRDLAAEVRGAADAGPPGADLLEALASRHELMPARLGAHLALLRSASPVDCLIVRGLDVDEAGLPPTPSDWRVADGWSTRTQETQVLLIAGCLGRAFGWEGQQDGRLVNDIVPVRSDENRQLNSSSRAAVSWHTEDAFQPHPADYVGLLGLRNRDGVRTGVSCAREWVPDARLDALFTTPVTQLPDLAYEDEARARTGPALFGDRRTPCVRLDPHYLRRPLPADVEDALAVLDAVVEQTMRRVAVGPGDVLLVDNMRAVHARDSFVPHYDGADRWLKRVTISREPRSVGDGG
jgi:hypothetical protein